VRSIFRKLAIFATITGISAVGVVATSTAANAADGGSSSCVENGGSVRGCHLYHVKLNGKSRTLRVADYTDSNNHKDFASITRNNSINMYVDPSVVKQLNIGLYGSYTDEYFTVDNDENRCYTVVQATRYVASSVPGVSVAQKYDKLQTATTGNSCNTK
jgi:hypothetical protein